MLKPNKVKTRHFGHSKGDWFKCQDCRQLSGEVIQVKHLTIINHLVIINLQ